MQDSKDINSLEDEPGLQFEGWESQKANGEIDKMEQERKAQETTRYYANLFTNAQRIKEVETNTAKASMDTYIGINGRQWSDKHLKALDDQNRVANTFNITKPNADKVLGQFIKNPYEATFTSVNQSTMGASNIVQSLYDYDMERGGWRREIHKFYKDAIIHTGIMEMYKDYSHSPLGNVGLRALNRYLDVRFDPYWSTERVSDCQYLFKSLWRTAREIKDEYQAKSEEIDRSINAFEKRDGAAIDNESIEELASREAEFYDATRDRYRVVEVTYMQRVYKKKKYKEKLDNYKKDNSNPDTMRGENETLIEFDEYENICKVMTMVPGVTHGLILQEGNHPVQIGKLPYFVASADVTMGERQGLVTGVIDAQSNLNKTKSMITGNQVTSNNGGLIVKQGFFKNASEFLNFTKTRNVPGKVFQADDNARLSDGIIPIPASQAPQGLEQSLQWTEMFIEKSMNNTDAINANTGSNESDRLFKSKRAQTNIAHAGLEETVMQALKEMAEAYFYFHKKVYSGPERTFTNARTGEQFSINKRVAQSEDKFAGLEIGNASVNNFLAGPSVINDISKLPRHDVVIRKSDSGLDQKEEAINDYDRMAQRSVNPIMKALWEKQMIPLMNMPQQAIEEMQAAADIFVTFQITQTKTQIAQMNNATEQSTIQTEQMSAQAQMQAQQTAGPDLGAQDIQGAREVGNGVGQGNLPNSVAEDSTGANNASPSDA